VSKRLFVKTPILWQTGNGTDTENMVIRETHHNQREKLKFFSQKKSPNPKKTAMDAIKIHPISIGNRHYNNKANVDMDNDGEEVISLKYKFIKTGENVGYFSVVEDEVLYPPYILK
jgi:hypothetical protein